MTEEFAERSHSHPSIANQMGTAKFLDEYFGNLDRNFDGSVTNDELLKARTDSQFWYKSEQIDQVIIREDVIRKQSFDFHWFNDSPDITRDDATAYLNKLNKLDDELQTAENVARIGIAIFPKIDADKNGVVDLEELDNYLRRRLYAEERFAASHLRDNIEQIGHITSETTCVEPIIMTINTYGISQSDLKALPGKIKAANRDLLK